MSRGIRSVLCAPAVRPSWQVSTSPPGMTALTASSALETCTPRSVRPAANPSQARMHHGVYITFIPSDIQKNTISNIKKIYIYIHLYSK